MTWKIEFGKDAKRDFAKLDRSIQRQIARYLETRIASAENPRDFGKSLAYDLTGLWRYRVGDYRVLCRIEDAAVVVLVIAIAHRSVVYD